jgi:hypothetical protein
MTTTTQGTFTSAADATRFIRGGNAIVTIASKRTGEHRTYRVSQPETDNGQTPPFFVGLLTGPDNGAAYTYAGILELNDGTIRLTRKSRFTTDAPAIRGWNYVARHLAEGNLPPDADVMHEGRCGCCGRALTRPDSIARGIGPECWKRFES